MVKTACLDSVERLSWIVSRSCSFELHQKSAAIRLGFNDARRIAVTRQNFGQRKLLKACPDPFHRLVGEWALAIKDTLPGIDQSMISRAGTHFRSLGRNMSPAYASGSLE